jgi:carboxyl-terminal processing protease
MKLKRTVLGPVMVAAVAVVSGGWLLQQGGSDDPLGVRNQRVFDEVLNRLSTDYVDTFSRTDLYRKAVDGLIREMGDPHTSFMTAEEYAALHAQTTGEYGGLGIQIDQKNGWITVIAPLPGTPAERAGLMAGDRIVEVEGRSTRGWTTDEAVKTLRGRPGQAVSIRVARLGVDEPIAYSIVREEIQTRAISASYLVDSDIGYARLTVFSETATSELRQAIERMKGEGMRGLILDLRQNPGGLLDQGISVADLFADRGTPVVETRSRQARDTRTFSARQPEAFPGLKLVVLVDEYSASASEIVAGALQDHDRALVLGATTFGKGSVQTLVPLSGGNYLKLTTGRWYTPVGRSIQRDYARNGGDVALMEDHPMDVDGTPVPAADTVTRRPYRTDGGRTVFGGGGIVPDLIVRPDTLTTAEKEFAAAVFRGGSTFNDVLFSYSIDFIRANPNLQQGFAVTPQMRAELFGRLQAAGLEVTRDQFDAARTVLDSRLADEITLHKFGQAAAVQRRNTNDAVMRTALDLMRRAPDQQALFRLAEQRAQTAQAVRR